MATAVNLDALIQREDFQATDGADAGESGKSTASLTDLRPGESFYSTLRKPDFQRETASWTPEAVCEFINAFVVGDLIPSVICWQSPSRLSFVIDGAHRLSAIIGWILDDYGSGSESIKFYNNQIPQEQRQVADKTRDLVKKTIGTYQEYKAEFANPGSNPLISARARGLAHSSIPLLWIKGNDSKKAERAFFTINQSAAAIDPTELKILNARAQDNAIASRAIVRNATGYEYWKEFSDTAKAEVVTTAKEIYRALYSPPLNPPIKTDELPIAGHGYGSQTLPLIFDFVNIANGFAVLDASKSKRKWLELKEVEAPNEKKTLNTIRNTDSLARRITGTHASSLGLHPGVYFYAANGRHQPTSVLAIAALLKEFDKDDQFIKFTKSRKMFEEFLLNHKMFVNQMTVKHGSMAKGYRQLKDYYSYVFELVSGGNDEAVIEAALKDHEKYQILVKEKPIKTKQAKDFSSDVKQFVYLKGALEKIIPLQILQCAHRQ